MLAYLYIYFFKHMKRFEDFDKISSRKNFSFRFIQNSFGTIFMFGKKYY